MMHVEEQQHALHEVDAAALAITETPALVVKIPHDVTAASRSAAADRTA